VLGPFDPVRPVEEPALGCRIARVPIRHEIRGALLWIVVDGDYDDAELRATWEGAFADPDFREGMLTVIDSRKTLANPSRAGVLERADLLARLRSRIGPRCALVVGDALHYGLGRMLAAFSAESGLEIQVFDDPARAEAWVAGAAGAPRR